MIAVSGRIGPIPAMIPMTLSVRWDDIPGREGYTQSYSYKIVQHRWLTALMVSMLTADVVWEWRSPPDEHTITHKVVIDFKDLGRYEAENVLSDRYMYPAVSDATRPITALLNNPYGKPPKVERIAVELAVRKGTKRARIRQFRLPGRIYRPGEVVTGKLIVQPYRQERKRIPVRFELPRDLPEGKYKLTACDYMEAAILVQKEMPQRFSPRTVKQLFESVVRIDQARRRYPRGQDLPPLAFEERRVGAG
jgi:hypothetical protein